jgi:hypothetical protein
MRIVGTAVGNYNKEEIRIKNSNLLLEVAAYYPA